jgi:hypothetical protein
MGRLCSVGLMICILCLGLASILGVLAWKGGQGLRICLIMTLLVIKI